MDLINRFLKYVSFETTSYEDAECFPSSPKVFELADYLVDELKGIGLGDAMRDEYGYVYADVYSRLVTEEGLMNPEYSVDGCHPVEAGYKAAAEVLRPLIDKLLG